MSKFTPGPWKVESDGSTTKWAMDYTLRGPGGKYLASLCETSDDPDLQARGWLPTEEGEANGRLIETAPKLLACLTDLVGLLTEGFHPDDIAVRRSIEEARAAIAKATGEQP